MQHWGAIPHTSTNHLLPAGLAQKAPAGLFLFQRRMEPDVSNICHIRSLLKAANNKIHKNCDTKRNRHEVETLIMLEDALSNLVDEVEQLQKKISNLEDPHMRHGRSID